MGVNLKATVTEQAREDERMAIRRRLSEERLRRGEERDRRLAEKDALASCREA